MYEAIAAIIFLAVALGFYFLCVTGDTPDKWLSKVQDYVRPTPVRRKRTRLDRPEANREEPVGSALQQLHKDLEGRRDGLKREVRKSSGRKQPVARKK